MVMHHFCCASWQVGGGAARSGEQSDGLDGVQQAWMAFITLNGCSVQTMMSFPQGSIAYPVLIVTQPSHAPQTTCKPHTTPQP
jgi:hypothetical protein